MTIATTDATEAAPAPRPPRALPLTAEVLPDSVWPDAEPVRARRTVRIVAVAVIAVTTAYLAWRIAATMGPGALLLGLPLLVIEAWALGALVLDTVAVWDLDRVRPPAPVTSTDTTVSVLIPSHDEPFEVMMPALAAAARMRMATSVLVLDDGHREWLAGVCDELGLEYRTRVRRLDGTGGQLNAVLPTLTTDLVLVLEPDQVAVHDIVGRLLPHFDDERVALVQAAQDVYNADSFEHVDHGRGRVSENVRFERVIGAGRNRWDAARWTGGAVMLRRSALDSVGGFAEAGTAAATSIRLHRAGWRSVQHNEVVSRGRAGLDFPEYRARQQARCRSELAAARREGMHAPAGLTPGQWLSYATGAGRWLASWRMLAYLVIPAAVLLLAASPASGPVTAFAVLLALVFLLRQLAMAIIGRGAAPHAQATAFSILRMSATLGATTALLTGQTEPRRPPARPDDARRVPALLVALLALNGAALVAAIVFVVAPDLRTPPATAVAIVAVLWCGANLHYLLRAVSRIRSTEFGGDRRLAHRVEVEGHAYVDGVRAHVLDLSLTGVRLLFYGPAPEEGTYCATTFVDPHRRTAVVTGTVVAVTRRPHGHDVRIAFEADQTYVLGAILADALAGRH